MQTFLPYEDFRQTAACLDYKRLGKQRVEAWQILNTLTGKSKGWRNHPAVLMWEGYEYTLCCYGIKMCQEWRRRGYKDTMLPRFMEALMEFQAVGMGYEEPAWFSNECLFASHRANLLRKDTNYYSRFGWVVNKHMPYYWPRQIKYLTK